MRAVGLLAAACVVFGGVFVVGERSALAQADESVLPPTVADGAKLVQVYAADSFFEGPTWDPASRKLYFTSFLTGNQQILRLDPGKVTVWLDRAKVNGTYLSFDKQLLSAQAYRHHDGIRLWSDGPGQRSGVVSQRERTSPTISARRLAATFTSAAGFQARNQRGVSAADGQATR